MRPNPVLVFLVLFKPFTIGHPKADVWVPFHHPEERSSVSDACEVVNTAVQLVSSVPDQYKGEVLAVLSSPVAAAAATWPTCQLARGNNCNLLTATISGWIFAFSTGVVVYNNQPLQGKKTGGKDELKRRVRSLFHDHLRSRSLEFDEIAIREDTTGDEDIAAFSVRGLRDPDGSLADHEVRFNTAKRTVVMMPSSDGTVSRRNSGTAFKISYNFYDAYSGGYADERAMRVVSDSVARDWASRMNEHHQWSSYIAALQFGTDLKMSLRIDALPTTWSDDYHDPNVCGKAEF
ncbi:hypothetical protein F4778DRAFT_181375 [Xylariomycetidae sp. FL2044]|nr:hypothetical protein F4778DRAFT_181375 [Xylariomycetidae sp. FL2044]